jgi:hypothetical protein
MEPMTMMFIASTTMSLLNAKKQSKAAEEQARHQQMLLNMKADEMGRRSVENLALMKEQGGKSIAKAGQQMSAGRYGRVGSESTARQVDDSYSNLFKAMEMQKRRDDWDIKMTRMGAGAAGDQAADARKAGYWNMLNVGVQSGMQAAMMDKKGYFG